MLITSIDGWKMKTSLLMSFKVSEVLINAVVRFVSVTFAVENDMDGEFLDTLLGVTQGPDCLKELVGKLGVRLKLYQKIKMLCNQGLVAQLPVSDYNYVHFIISL